MPLVSSSIPNLINGVSQQPDIIRLPSQADIQENCSASPVEGLGKRPPTEFEFVAGEAAFATTSILPHLIDRTDSERYQILFADKGIRITNLRTKEAVPVKFKDAARAYLDCNNPASDLRAMTVSDYTFVVNRTKTVRALPDVIDAARPDACVWVKTGNYGAAYTITLDGTPFVFKTPLRAATEGEWDDGRRFVNEDGTVVTPAAGYTTAPFRELPQYLTAQLIATDRIADKLMGLLKNHPTIGSKFNFTRSGSLLRIRPVGTTTEQGTTYRDFTLSVSDSLGDTMLEAYKDKLQRYTDLPQYCFNGFRMKVMGDAATEFDDYYVRFEGSKTTGTWVEDIAPKETYKMDPATLPHALVRQADGTFSFEAIEWENRKAGDKKSSPMPSFVDKKIRDLFFFRDRLGFVAQENVVMSRYGDYFDFFRASALQMLDNDPIDVSISHTKVTDINHAVAFNETLLLFGLGVQFQIGDAELLTPKTVAFHQVTEFRCSTWAKPVGMGANLYFGYDRGPSSTILEYYVDKESVSKNAEEITSHVPTYIPDSLRQIAVCDTEDMLFMVTAAQPNVLFVYNSMWMGQDKLQSAIHRWIFDPLCRILAVQSVGSRLYLVMLREDVDAVVVESINLAPGVSAAGVPYRVHLDRLLQEQDVSTTYDENLSATVITLPFKATPDLRVIAREGNPVSNSYTSGRKLFTGYVEGEQVEYRIGRRGRIVVPGRLTKFWIGLPYTMRYRFSTFYMRQTNSAGATQAVVDGRLQMRRLNLNYAGSSYFRVVVTPVGRPAQEYPMTAKTIGERGTAVGRVQVLDGTFKVPVLAKNTGVQVEIINDTFLPSRFLSAEWEAEYNPRAKRIA